jgi:euchromatic histone-lysine N-methyltransferase
MSTKFNEQTNSELVKNLDYQEDKTLKWKTLINNTYAKKDREKRNKNRNKDGEDSTTVDDDKSSIQPSSSTASTSSATMSKNNPNSTTVSDKKNSKTTSMESADEEAKSNLIITEKFGNNVKEKKIVIDGDDLHTQKSAAAQQASSTHTNTTKESNDDVEKNINLPQLNTNSQAITTVTSSTSTTDNKLKHDDNTEIMSSTSSGVVGVEDDKRNAGGLTTKSKTLSSNGGKVIDKTTSSPRNLRSNKNSSANSSQNSATLIQRQSSSSMSDDKNKVSDEMAIKSDLEENEANNEDSSTTNETAQISVVKKGRGRPKLESKNTNTPSESKIVNNNKSSTTSTECATDQPAESELEMNQKRASRGRVLKTRSILEPSEEKKCETPTGAISANATKSEDVEVKKETETDDSSTPIRRSGRSRKLATDDKDDKDNNSKIVEVEKDKMEVDSNQSEEQNKRTRLNTKKSNEAESADETKSDTKSVIDDDIKPRLLMTIRTDKSTAVPKIIAAPTTGNGNGNGNNSTAAPSNASATADNDQEEKVVKKRGRRPKAASITKPIQVKKSTRLAKDDSDANISTTPVHSPRKDPALLSAPAYGRMRSQRRIKPTAKILENEELRQGFEVTNCKRLSLSNENLMMEVYERSPPTVNRSGNESSNRSPNVSSPESKNTSIDIPAEVAEILKNNAKKPCRDPQEFLNEIKSFKIGINRSPEDNKKLTKSQHRRLIKQKEKHLSLLGLQPRNEYSSSSDESDTEEFNPTTSNRSASHRPAITLRLRNQHKASADSQKQKNLQLRKREHSDATHGEKRMKLSSNEKIPELDSSDDDCIVIESRNEGTYGNSNGKENSNINLICSCHQKTKYYMRQGQNVSLSVNGKIFCCAIDEIEKRKIGCTNELTESLISLYRPSVKVSYMVLCSSHKKRLASHNCCSGCGLFCTQGTFVICDNKHFFHRNCATKYILNTPYDPNNPNYTGPTLLLKCPHCGIDAPNYDFRVTMRCENLPVFVQHRSNVP